MCDYHQESSPNRTLESYFRALVFTKKTLEFYRYVVRTCKS